MKSSTLSRSHLHEDLTADGAERLVAARESGDAAACRRAEEALVVEYLPVASMVAKRYARRGIDFDDVEQVARLGLVKGIRGWQPEKGGLLGYLMPTIRGEVKRYFRDKSAAIRIPRSLYEAHPRVTAAERALRGTLAREPSVAEIAAAARLTVEQVRQVKAAPETSRPLSTSDTSDWRGELASDAAEHELSVSALRTVLRPALAKLSDREQKIIALRFVWGQSQAQIAATLGYSQMHISRLLTAALKKLRESIDVE